MQAKLVFLDEPSIGVRLALFGIATDVYPVRFRDCVGGPSFNRPMEFDLDAAKELVRRIRTIAGPNGAPPAPVLHAFMLLAGTTPEHIAAGHREQDGSVLNPGGEPARWTLLALNAGMLTVVDATGRGERSWTLESTSKTDTVPETFDAVTFPVTDVSAVRVSDVKSRRWDGFELSVAKATWTVEVPGRSIEVPCREETVGDAEAFAAGVIMAVQQRRT